MLRVRSMNGKTLNMVLLYSFLLCRSDQVAALAERSGDSRLGKLGVQGAVLSTAVLQKLLLRPIVEWASI